MDIDTKKECFYVAHLFARAEFGSALERQWRLYSTVHLIFLSRMSREPIFQQTALRNSLH